MSTNINNVDNLSQITNDDKVFMSDGGTLLRKTDVTTMAKYVLETYTGSSIGGSAQSAKSAIDSMSSSISSLNAAAATIPTDAHIRELVGTPLVASTVSGMTDQTKIYVYTGSETGYTAGHWYYYNGSAWTDGGTYNSAGVDTDKTLSVTDKAADGKAVGDAITSLNGDLTELAESASRGVNTDATGTDLDIVDSSGYVLARFSDGHIQTKNFDSSDIADMESALDDKLDNNLGASNVGKILRVGQDGDVVTDNMPATGDVMSKGTTATSDMDFTDINGNVIMRFKNGHVQTKNFDSSLMRQLSGKKWACIGDSLTEVNVRTTLHYHDYIAQETGIQIYNLGHSGCGYAKVGGYGKNFIGIAAEVPNDADVITIFGSGNDGSAGLDLGTPTDTGTSTLCGCINATLDVIYANHPTVPIGVITPTPWANAEPSDGSTVMKNYSAAIVEICARRGIPCLDLYHCSNLHPTDVNFRPLAYSKDDGDGVHPDETGHKIIAPRFRQFLFSLI